MKVHQDLNAVELLYISCGKSSYPNITGAQIVYAGIAVRSFHTHAGGGVNFMYMPEDLKYKSDLAYRSGADDHSQLHGINQYRVLMTTMFLVQCGM